MKKTLILICFTLYVSVALAANVNGPGAVASGETHSYSYNDGTSVQSKLSNFNVSPNGTILNRYIAGGVYWADIKWNVAGPGTVYFTGGTSKAVTVSQGPTTTISAINVTSTSFTARWNAATGASSYRLDVATSSSFGASILPGYNGLSTGSSTNANVSGLTEGTTYYYQVRAVSSGGSVSVNSNTTSVVTLPAAPIASDASDITSGSFTANWSVVAVATGYKLDVSTNSGFTSFFSIYNGLAVSGNSYSVTGLNPNTTYYYRVRAVKGTANSANSNTKSVQTLFVASVQGYNIVNTGETHVYNYNDGTTVASRLSYFSVTPNGTILNRYISGGIYWAEIKWNVAGPATVYYTGGNSLAVTVSQSPPIALDAINHTTSSFTARWQTATGASSYQLDVATTPDFSNILPAYNGLSTTNSSVNVTGLAQGTYYYRVRAVSASAGSSVNSTSISVTLLPTPPVALAANGITSSSFIANWQNTSGTGTSYKLYVSTNNSFSSYLPGYNGSTASGTSATVSGLDEKTTYYYKVQAVKSSGTSNFSNIVLAVNLAQNYILFEEVGRSGVTSESQLNSISIGEKMVSYSFFDGLGRPSQTVLKQQSPNQQDIVQPFAYDAFGRENTQYLPYVSGTDGWFKPDFLRKEDAAYGQSPQYQFYQNTPRVATDGRPYSELFFEASPLNEVIKQAPPGDAWLPNADPLSLNDKGIKRRYEINDGGEVYLLTYDASNNAIKLGNGNQEHYTSGLLYRNLTYDEHNAEVLEYTNMEGQLVAKKVFAYNQGTQKVSACTYYVYDDFGNLICVIQPEGIRNINEFIVGNTLDKEAFLKKWSFRYGYDDRRRMVMKQVPGAEPVYMVYDSRDRLVMTQDGNQRDPSLAAKEWTFTKYDVFNRPVLTGKYTSNNDRVTVQSAVNAYYTNLSGAQAWFETYQGAAGAVHGYSNNSYPNVSAATDYYSATYYDLHDSYIAPSGFTYLNESLPGQGSSAFANEKGLVTATLVKNLSNDAFLRTVNYYDDRYRVIQSISDHHLGTARTSNVYDFTGKVLTSKRSYVVNSATTTIKETFSYDHAGRVKTINHRVGEAVKWISHVNTSATGGILTKNAGGNAWNAGAFSENSLGAGKDGWVEFTGDNTTTYRMLGFSDQDVNAGYDAIDYAFELAENGEIYIFENGAYRGLVGTYTQADVFQIERKNGTIYYKKNGNSLYTSTVPSSGVLYVDAALYNQGTSLINATLGQGSPDIQILALEYNELGQLIDKRLHSDDGGTTFKQSVDYLYNIRGWLTKINDADVSAAASGDTGYDYFGMELTYDKTVSGLTTTQMFNGNISAMQWSKGNGGSVGRQAYTFQYDSMDRLKTASHFDHDLAWQSYNRTYQEKINQYDLNGNIRKLSRRGFGGALIDSMLYSYSGNRLSYVHDYGYATEGFINGNTGTDDYDYDYNGNLDKDRNKGILTKGNIKYNYLNLPKEISKGTESIKYIYDASGRKMRQEVYSNNGATLVKYTDYIGELVYEGGNLQFIQHSEGRVLPAGGSWEYQYHLKDHLGNVRVTFTTKPQTPVTYTANLENGNGSSGEGVFGNYTSTAFDLVDHTDAGTTYQRVQWLNGGASGRVGLTKSLSVMPGDKVSVTAYAKYRNLTGTGNTNPFAAALTAAFGVSSGSTGEQLKLYNSLNAYGVSVAGGNHPADDDTAPKGFVTILLFDRNYNLLDAAWDQVTTTLEQVSATNKEAFHHALSKEVIVQEPGYAYIFMSNEHPTYVDVYFDDVTVGHTLSPIVSSSDYYPFGLTYNSYSRENSAPQDYKFNGKEEQTELGLGWLDFGRRMHQPEIGRFFTQDRFAEKYYAMNPYQYGANNPIVFNDINGDSLWISFGNNNRVLYNNGQLQNADGSRYEGEGVKVTKKGNIRITDSFLRGTVSALNTIGSAEAGAGLIGELQSSDNNFTIKQGNFRFDPDNKNDASFFQVMDEGKLVDPSKGMSGKIGSGGTIYFNPSVSPTINGTTYSSTIALAHEMFHGSDSNSGELDSRSIPFNGVCCEQRQEIRATYFQNVLSQQLGGSYPLRTYYGGTQYPPMPPALINGSTPLNALPPSLMMKIQN